MDSITQDIIQQLNQLCSTYQRLQVYFSNNYPMILQDLETLIKRYHEQYDISDLCHTQFGMEPIDRNKMYAFIYHINNELGFYEFLEMYGLDYETYKKLEEEAYEYYYEYALEHMLPSQVDRTKIDWKAVKAYKEQDQTRITQFFKQR